MVDFVVGDRRDAIEMVVRGRWGPEATAAVHDAGVQRLVLNYALGFNESSLAFLDGLQIRELQILDRRITDPEPIYSLAPTLEALRVTTHPDLKIDLERLPLLQRLAADWSQVSQTIDTATCLRDLYVGSYRAADLTPLSSLSGLVKLTMKDRPSLKSLHGLNVLPELRTLGIYLATGLADISDLVDRTGIEDLALEACRKVPSLEPLAKCAGLRLLNLGDVGDLPSVTPLADLGNLEELWMDGDTKILDGDLSPLTGLPKLRRFRMQSRRFYRPSVQQIQGPLSLP